MMTLSVFLALFAGGVNSAWAETIIDDFTSYSATSSGQTLGDNWYIFPGDDGSYGRFGSDYTYKHNEYDGADYNYISGYSSNYNKNVWLVLTKEVSGTVTFRCKMSSSTGTIYVTNKVTKTGDTFTVDKTGAQSYDITTTTVSNTYSAGEDATYVAFCIASSNLRLLDVTYTEYVDAGAIAKPTAFAATSTTYNSATLSWTAGGEETAWQLVYDTNADFDKDAATPIDVTKNPYTLSGLADNTTYYAYLRAKIGDEVSSWTGKLSFTTPLAPIATFPWTENFNSLTSGIPTGWDNSEGTTTTDSYKWNYYSTGHDGAGLRFNSYNNSSDNTNYLKTPILVFGDKSMKLTFWYKNPKGGDFSVYASTDGGETYTIELATGLTNQTDWVQKDFLIPAEVSGDNVVIVFKGTSNWGSGDAYIYLDDVTVKENSANAPELAINTDVLDFGKLTADAEEIVTVTNNGTGQLTVNIASDSEDFEVSPTKLENIAAGESKTFTVTFKYVAGNYGAKTANITVTPTYDETAAVTIAASALAKDPNVWEEDFEEGKIPEGWDNNGFVVKMESVGSYPTYDLPTYFAVGNGGSGVKTLVTPLLKATAGDKLTFDGFFYYGDEVMKVDYSTDRNEWNNLYEYDKTSYSSGETHNIEISAPITGEFYLRFTVNYFNGIDNIVGFKLATKKEHDAIITAQSIPATGTQYVEYTATVTVKELAGKEDEVVTAELWIGTEMVTEVSEVKLAANDEKVIELIFTPDKAISGNAYIKVYNTDIDLTSEKVAVKISAALVLDEEVGLPDGIATGETPSVVFKYTPKSGWNTIATPFALTTDILAQIFGEGYKVFELNSYDGTRIDFKPATMFSAGYPYLVYVETAPDAPAEGFKLFNVNITTTENFDSKSGAEFHTTYSPIAASSMTDTWYGVTPAGEIRLAGPNASLKGFRAYFIGISETGAPLLSIEGEDATTGIDVLRQNIGEDAVIYDLNGRRVETPNKGLYIINGKKVMIK